MAIPSSAMSLTSAARSLLRRDLPDGPALGWFLAAVCCGSVLATGEELSLPPRPAGAPGGRAAALSASGLAPAAREELLAREILSGNVPDFQRKLVEVAVKSGEDRLVFHAAPDYLSVGNDADFFRTPLSPGTASRIANRLGCTLPTRKMVDAIHAAAPVKLVPAPRSPGPDMTTIPAFLSYQESIRILRDGHLARFPHGTLVAGHQKDVVQTFRLPAGSGKVAIYGWHRPDGTVIQPLFAGHAETWVDYSHGIRLVSTKVTLNGRESTVGQILANPATAALLSDELPVPAGNPPLASGERQETLETEPGIRIIVNRPAATSSGPARPVKLVVYALPNGNSIEQTMGRHPGPDTDWRFGIQHIAAQTRWLRQRQPETEWIVAWLECAGQSWPAWCRQQPDSGSRIAAMLQTLRRQVENSSAKLVLTGHSGGGAFIFRYLDSQESIPGDVERIAFLDSNYAYDAAKGHAAKLSAWLGSAEDRFLTVVAYHDSIALLDGKTFVSESGGTWGRSHAMLKDLGNSFNFRHTAEGPLQQYTALNGRMVFLLMENPEKAVLHTRLVERNGYLHALLTGTPAAGRDYQFFGNPVYGSLISGP